MGLWPSFGRERKLALCLSGTLDTTAAMDVPTIEGTVYGAAPTSQTDATGLGTPLSVPPTTFKGGMGTAPAFAYQDVPLQIANVNFGGPMKLNQPTHWGH